MRPRGVRQSSHLHRTRVASRRDDGDDEDVDEVMNESTNWYKKSRLFKLVDKAVSHVANARFNVLIIKLVHLHREPYN